MRSFAVSSEREKAYVEVTEGRLHTKASRKSIEKRIQSIGSNKIMSSRGMPLFFRTLYAPDDLF